MSYIINSDGIKEYLIDMKVGETRRYMSTATVSIYIFDRDDKNDEAVNFLEAEKKDFGDPAAAIGHASYVFGAVTTVIKPLRMAAPSAVIVSTMVETETTKLSMISAQFDKVLSMYNAQKDRKGLYLIETTTSQNGRFYSTLSFTYQFYTPGGTLFAEFTTIAVP